ncbi:MAG: aminopeptidase P family protein [Actinobacteria bacterium]|nr:aminopeptidase P family protein [Actinomycetota bacterium]
MKIDGELRKNRLRKLDDFLEKHKADIYLTTLVHEIYYFTGAEVEGHYIYCRDKEILFTSKIYEEDAKKNSLSEILIVAEKDYTSELKELLIEFSTRKCLISDQERVQTLNLAKKSKLRVKTANTASLRVIKDEVELKSIKKAYEIIEKAIFDSLKQVKEGISELELKAEIAYLVRKYGGSDDSFNHIVAFGKNSSLPHAKSSNKKLKFGDLILIDAGAKYKGYCSDITRCFLFGKDNKEIREKYESLVKAKQAAVERLEEGISLSAVDEAARKKLEDYGLDKYFTHGLGHGLGLEIHEEPAISRISKANLQSGMVFTIEPGIYFEGKFGLRTEDGYTFDKKPIKLSKFPDEILVI